MSILRCFDMKIIYLDDTLNEPSWPNPNKRNSFPCLVLGMISNRIIGYQHTDSGFLLLRACFVPFQFSKN